ncbi:MAG TPA: VOC family protein [Rubellimicrobium sp.]|nr:VOC family protein [Rubellimicrobium sp.]
MILNHVNLAVTDVAAAKSFLMTYFGLVDTGWGRGPNMAFLKDDRDSILSMFACKEVSYPGTFHIGFRQPDRAAVTAMNDRLLADGFAVKPPRELHLFTFYVDAPGGFQVEVMSD